jgi:hypothetical protein
VSRRVRMVSGCIGYCFLSYDTRDIFTRRIDRARKSNVIPKICGLSRSPCGVQPTHGVQMESKSLSRKSCVFIEAGL